MVKYAIIHAMLQWFDWAYKSAKGRSDTTSLSFVSLPTSLVAAIEKVWHSSIKAGGKAAW
jgi:hypothetical protein